MEDLMGTARLAYAPDAVLMMRRLNPRELAERYGSEDSEGQLEQQGIAPLVFTLAKGRDGMSRGSWDAEFHFRRSTITEGSTEMPRVHQPHDQFYSGSTNPIGATNDSIDEEILDTF